MSLDLSKENNHDGSYLPGDFSFGDRKFELPGNDRFHWRGPISHWWTVARPSSQEVCRIGPSGWWRCLYPKQPVPQCCNDWHPTNIPTHCNNSHNNSYWAMYDHQCLHCRKPLAIKLPRCCIDAYNIIHHNWVKPEWGITNHKKDTALCSHITWSEIYFQLQLHQLATNRTT